MKATAGGQFLTRFYLCVTLLFVFTVHRAFGEESLFTQEQATLKSCLASGVATDSAGFAAELFDGFSEANNELWEVWRDEQSPKGEVEYDGASVNITYPLAQAQDAIGLRSRERLVTVPEKEGATFLIRLDIDTERSKSGALILTPKLSDTLFNRPQIRLSFLREEKFGTIKIEVGAETLGEFKVPLVRHYGLGLILSDKEMRALDPTGKVILSAPLPSWAAPGTSLYVWLCAIACPTLSKGFISVNSIRLRHPLTLRAKSCLAWGFLGFPAIEEEFSEINEDIWKPWSDGGANTSLVTTSAEGLHFSVPGGVETNKFGRYGLCTREPIVQAIQGEREFTAIEMTIDTTYTSGARMVLVTSPRESVWETPHIRLGLERRGLVCEAWLGCEKSIAGRFQLPLSNSCLVTLLLGKHGVYVVGPDCGLRSVMPLPDWAKEAKAYHLLLYSHAPRPREPVALKISNLRVTNKCRAPSVQKLPSEGQTESTTKTVSTTGTVSTTSTITTTKEIIDILKMDGSLLAGPGTTVTTTTTTE